MVPCGLGQTFAIMAQFSAVVRIGQKGLTAALSGPSCQQLGPLLVVCSRQGRTGFLGPPFTIYRQTRILGQPVRPAIFFSRRDKSHPFSKGHEIGVLDRLPNGGCVRPEKHQSKQV